MPKKTGNLLGAWAFLIGVILAVIFGLFVDLTEAWVGWVLVIIGIIVGLFNISDTEASTFLLAGVALVIVSYFGGSVFEVIRIGTLSLANVLNALLMLFVPATIIVALKSVFSIAKS